MPVMTESCHLRLKITPGAKASEITGITNGTLNLKIKASPVKGKANQELLDFLSKKLGIAKSDIEIIQGFTQRNKIVIVSGLSSEGVFNKLGL